METNKCPECEFVSSYGRTNYHDYSCSKNPDFQNELVKENGVNQTNDWRVYFYDRFTRIDVLETGETVRRMKDITLAENVEEFIQKVREEAVRDTEEKAKKIVEIELGWVRTQKGNHAQAGVERMLEKILSALGEIKGYGK